MLFYFWFRSAALRHNLHEGFFQKLERNWDVVMARESVPHQAARDVGRHINPDQRTFIPTSSIVNSPSVPHPSA
jgi:hypothetical protein